MQKQQQKTPHNQKKSWSRDCKSFSQLLLTHAKEYLQKAKANLIFP